jgi:hypothetical protein
VKAARGNRRKYLNGHPKAMPVAAMRKWRTASVVEYEIVPNGDGFSVQIYDAPAIGWRILFREKDGAIEAYTKYDDAKAGVQIYDRSDKTVLFEAELEVYLRSARMGIALDGCGLPSLVRFGEPGHWVYATFTLSEGFVKQSCIEIIGYKKGEEPIYSAGWSASQ